MLIRSQDKETIIKCNKLYINEIRTNKRLYEIVTDESEEIITLGIYSSKEKALKVLDMIQEKMCGVNGILKLNGRYNDTQRKYIKQRIDEEIKEGTFLPDSHLTYIPTPLFFQMPQDDEV